jgi:hypothetical protein
MSTISEKNNLEKMKKDKLKELLKKENLNTKGLKKVLIERLITFNKDQKKKQKQKLEKKQTPKKKIKQNNTKNKRFFNSYSSQYHISNGIILKDTEEIVEYKNNKGKYYLKEFGKSKKEKEITKKDLEKYISEKGLNLHISNNIFNQAMDIFNLFLLDKPNVSLEKHIDDTKKHNKNLNIKKDKNKNIPKILPGTHIKK